MPATPRCSRPSLVAHVAPWLPILMVACGNPTDEASSANFSVDSTTSYGAGSSTPSATVSAVTADPRSSSSQHPTSIVSATSFDGSSAQSIGSALSTETSTSSATSGTTTTVSQNGGTSSGLPTNSQSSQSGLEATDPSGTTASDDNSGEPQTTEGCTIDAPVLKLGKIATVGVVTFATSLGTIDSGYVKFGPSGGELSTKAPIDVADPEHKTYLLGLKQSKDYTFQAVISSEGKTCASAEQTFTTGTLGNAPTVSKSGTGGTRGFIVGSDGLGAALGGGGGGGGANLYIFDTDGDVVWASAGPSGASRARLDWDAKHMWGMALNVGAGQGRMDRISVDGETVESNIPALTGGHHDFTVLPDGHVAVLAWITPSSNQGCTEILDYDPVAKTAKRIVRDVNTLYKTVSDCHTNAITYQEKTKTFIVSDRNPNLYVKFSETGEPIWQLGGSNPIATQLAGDGQSWQVNHGHMLTDDGRFLLFNNGSSGQSTVREFQIDEAAGTATAGKNVTDGSSLVLGDVQALSNGNLWVTYSTAGSMKEYDTTGKSVAEYKVGVGYSYFTSDLYAKPVNK